MWHHSVTLVYDHQKPSANWTDLDLSGVVGANYALVLLKVKCFAGTEIEYAFRPDGDTDDYISSRNSPSGGNYLRIGPGSVSLAILETGSNGYIEWCSPNGSGNEASIWILGYIK